MQQHPLPQNVMSVEFQLVGNLTLRQFAYLAVGGMIVFLVWVVPFSDFIKYPLMVALAGFFAALAWLPVNDIGLDRWLVAFFRAINSPTKRVWRREIKELVFFSSEYNQALGRSPLPATQDRSRLEEYLATLKSRAPRSELDLAEDAYLASLPFEPVGQAVPAPLTPTIYPSPSLEAIPKEVLPPVTPEKRVVEEDLTKPTLLAPAIKPVVTIHLPDKNIYLKKVSTTTVNRSLHPLTSLEGTVVLPVRGETRFELSEDLKQRLMPVAALLPPAPAAPQPPAPVVPQTPPVPPAYQEILTQPIPVPHQEGGQQVAGAQIEAMEKQLAAEAEITRQRLLTGAIRPQGSGLNQVPLAEAAQPAPAAPENLMIKPATPGTPAPPAPTPAPIPEVKETPKATPPPPVKKEDPTPTPTAPTAAVGKMAPPPANVPNVIVGLVRDQNGLLLVEVVIIVKDQQDEPVRALKTNKVGQFAISTPLPNGNYTIELEKDGFEFDTIAVNLNGEIFTPIEIKAQPLLGVRRG